jgi:hypothetical protein
MWERPGSAVALWSLARLDGATAVIATRVPEGTQSKENMGRPETPRPQGQDLEVLAMTIPPECAVLWRMTCKIALLKNRHPAVREKTREVSVPRRKRPQA